MTDTNNLEERIQEALAKSSGAGLTSVQIHSLVPGSFLVVADTLKRMQSERKIIRVNYPIEESDDPYPRYISNIEYEPASARPKKDPTLRESLRSTLNKASAENASNTPDHILAKYLLDCLKSFDVAANARDEWHGIAPKPFANHRNPNT